MTLKISIEMDNAAFEDGSGVEAARILRCLANVIDGGDVWLDTISLRDINGNNVGTAKVTR